MDLLNKMISNIKPNFEDFYFKNIKVLNYLGNYEEKMK